MNQLSKKLLSHAGWTLTCAAVTLILMSISGWSPSLELAACIGLGAAASFTIYKQWWYLPALVGCGYVISILALSMGFSPIVPVTVGLAAFCTHCRVNGEDRWAKIQRTLSAGALTGFSLYILQLTPWFAVDHWSSALVVGSIAGCSAATWIWVLPTPKPFSRLPSWASVVRQLEPPYRQPVRKSLLCYRNTRTMAPDHETKSGLKEVVLWVFHLQKSIQKMDEQIKAIDVISIHERIEQCSQNKEQDPFTQERLRATESHLRLLLEHKEAMELERRRSGSLVEYALAFLEEAQAALGLAMQTASQSRPARLSEVLLRLRTYSRDEMVRKQTLQEVSHLSA